MSARAHRQTPWGKVRGCACSSCSEAQRRADNHFARNTFIGLGLGLTAAWILDLIIGGPGILSIFTGA